MRETAKEGGLVMARRKQSIHLARVRGKAISEPILEPDDLVIEELPPPPLACIQSDVGGQRLMGDGGSKN